MNILVVCVERIHDLFLVESSEGLVWQGKLSRYKILDADLRNFPLLWSFLLNKQISACFNFVFIHQAACEVHWPSKALIHIMFVRRNVTSQIKMTKGNHSYSFQHKTKLYSSYWDFHCHHQFRDTLFNISNYTIFFSKGLMFLLILCQF